MATSSSEQSPGMDDVAEVEGMTGDNQLVNVT